MLKIIFITVEQPGFLSSSKVALDSKVHTCGSSIIDLCVAKI